MLLLLPKRAHGTAHGQDLATASQRRLPCPQGALYRSGRRAHQAPGWLVPVLDFRRNAYKFAWSEIVASSRPSFLSSAMQCAAKISFLRASCSRQVYLKTLIFS